MDFTTQKICVVGDIMLDEYVFGTVGRISPEAPVPVVAVTRDARVPGGAANVALNLAGLKTAIAAASLFTEVIESVRPGNSASETGTIQRRGWPGAVISLIKPCAATTVNRNNPRDKNRMLISCVVTSNERSSQAGAAARM